MKVICVNSDKIRQSEKSFTNCAYQQGNDSLLTCGKEYTILLCKRPILEKAWTLGLNIYNSDYFTMDEKYFNENEPTWVAILNDTDKEWYYLDRFVSLDTYRNKQLNKIGI